MPVTDMGDSISRPRHASGSSAFYYDFDSLQEMAITTGGADAQNATSGVQLNMVLKTGTNRPHGSLRVYFENEACSRSNIAPELAAAGKGNRLDQYQDYGFELGGPLLKDWVWIWGTMALDVDQSADAHRVAGRHFVPELCVQGGRKTERVDPGKLHLLREQEGEDRPRRGTDTPAGNDVVPERPDDVLQGRGQLRDTQELLCLGEMGKRGRRLPARARGRPRP